MNHKNQTNRRIRTYLLIRVEEKGSAIDVLVGRAGTCNWICLPGMEVASHLSNWSDTFWNLEKLFRLISRCDAITITNMLAMLVKNKGKPYSHIHRIRFSFNEH